MQVRWQPVAADGVSKRRGAQQPQALEFTRYRSAWLADAGVLLVADVHLGKAARFRQLGVPVPEATTQETLSRLEKAIESHDAQRVVVLGDLLHGPRCVTPQLDDAWQVFREKHASVQIQLVRGNHDVRAGDPPRHWGVEALDELSLAGWRLCHEPPDDVAQAPWIAGHIHPTVLLSGRAGDRLRLPCFHATACGVVIPAFGAFTGGHAVTLQPGDHAWAVAPDGLLTVQVGR